CFHFYKLFLFFYLFVLRPIQGSTLFPYTTLFRSRRFPFRGTCDYASCSCRVQPIHRQGRCNSGCGCTKTSHRLTVNWLNPATARSEEHTSELQSLAYLVCRLLLEKKKLIYLQLIM